MSGARSALSTAVVFGLASLLLAQAASAQGRGQGQGRGRGAPGPGMGGPGPALLRDTLPGRGPIAILLAERDSLALSAQQVRQLQQLDSALQQQNAPLVAGMLELRREVQPLVGMHPRDMTPAQREQFAKQAARARPIMQQVQENNRRAMERVSAVLTAAQKRWVRERLPGGRLMGGGREGA